MNSQRSSALPDSLPRVRLALLPTPVQALSRLGAALGGLSLFIERDDQTGLATGGNKTRKLEFLIGAALAEGADCLITAGSTQSNHARQTAAAARAVGMEPHLVLYAPNGQAPATFNGNLLLDHLFGAVFHWEDTRSTGAFQKRIEQVSAALRAAGRHPYAVPYGGSSPVCLLGYADAMLELREQIDTGSAPAVDTIVFATSSGGTQAGMLLGLEMAGLRDIRLLGISIDERREQLAPRVQALANEGAALLGLDWQPAPEQVDIDDGYLGDGYAIIGAPEREAIQLLAQHEGILADPVYTGRALAGLIDMARRGEFRPDERVLFWHTGGAAALFAFSDQLTRIE